MGENDCDPSIRNITLKNDFIKMQHIDRKSIKMQRCGLLLL